MGIMGKFFGANVDYPALDSSAPAAMYLESVRTPLEKMIAETKSYPILDGARGTPALDKKALQRLLLLCSEIVESYPQIQEMDLNPVIVHQKGVSVVDVRIILKPEDGGQRSEVRKKDK